MPFLSLLWGFLKGIPWQVWAVSAVVGAGWWYIGHVERIAWAEGAAHVQAQWDNWKVAQAKANAEAVEALNAKYRKLESESKAKQEAIGADYEKKLKEAKTQRDRDVAAARAGTLSLSIPSNCPSPNRSPASEISPSPVGSDGEARTELPREIVANLFALADDADAIIDQLGSCQAIVLADRQPQPKGGDP